MHTAELRQGVLFELFDFLVRGKHEFIIDDIRQFGAPTQNEIDVLERLR